MNYLMFILLDVIMVVFLIIGLQLLCKFVYRCDVSKMKQFTVNYFDKDPLSPMNRTQKLYLAVCFLYILNILIPTVLNQELSFVVLLNKFGTTGITIVWVVFCCILCLDGQPVLNFQKVAVKHVKWSVLLLVISAIMMSNAFTADVTSIKPLVISVANPILGNRGPWGVVCILMIFGFVITNFANNFV